jgi:transposase
MPEGARRIEIFTGAGRRRVWPAALKAEIIAEIGVDGVTASAVARRHGLTPSQLFAWRREARGATASSGFVPVVSETPFMAPASPKRGLRRRKGSAVATGAAVEVAMGDAVIRVLPGADERTIAAVLSAMKLVR